MATNTQQNLQLLLDACLLLSSKLELPGLLLSIMDFSARVVGAETASLLLLDPKANELYFHVALGLDSETSKIRLKMGQGIAGTVAKEGKAVIINDVRAEPRWSPQVDQESGFQTKSILAVPMKIKGRLVGVIEAINHIEGPFTQEDLRIFEAFASQAAVALDNAQLVASLQEEKTKLDTVFSQMNDAAVLTDADGNILLANSATHQLLNADKQTPKTIGEELSSVQVTPPLADILASTKAVVEFEAVREHPKKLVLAGTASTLQFDAVGSKTDWQGRLFMFRDVTEQRQEEMLKRSFLSLISHKLKTPLSSITGYSQLLLEDLRKKQAPETLLRPLDTILGQGKKLSELVDKLLRFVTLQQLDAASPTVRSVNIDEAMTHAIQSMQKWFLEKGAVVTVGTPTGYRVYVDAQMIQDAIRDLMENAVKFNTKPEKHVNVHAEARDGFIVVHVQDDGPGIPPEDQEKIFSKFHQVEPFFTGQVEGWGLGLPFVKQVVHYHGGKVSLKSRINEGTTVSISLPQVRA